MELRKVLALRGPNIWATFPVLEAWLDLGAEKDKDTLSSTRPEFAPRLLALFPPFTAPLATGLPLPSIVERLCLELQHATGAAVTFSRTRELSQPGVHKIIVEYHDEAHGRAALDLAVRLVRAALDGTALDTVAELAKLRELSKQATLRPETAALVAAARQRRIPVRFLNTNGLIQLGHGASQRRLQGSQTDRTGATAESIARDNHLTRNLLRAIGVPVASGDLVNSADAAWNEAEDLGLPVSIRPRYGRERRPEWSGLQTRDQVHAAYRTASDDGDDPVLVERMPAGVPHYFLVVAGRTVAALRCADGQTEEVTAALHPETAARVAEAARVVGLDVAGVEVLATTVSQPLEEQGGAVLAVHAQPEMALFLRPDCGEPQPVADAIVRSLFPTGTGRIPVLSITGTNGKTTTTRLIAHILSRVYHPVGMACSESISVGERLIEKGDCSGPKSARAVLGHPEARAAVLETARGGILREGLGFDFCDVAVVTNIAKADHLGLHDIHRPEQLVEVKRAAVPVVLPGGAAVLNAADPLVAGMAEVCPADVIYFARDPNHPVIVAHRAAGKRVVLARDGQIVLADGTCEQPLVALNRVPLTHGGRVGFNVENALAATAAAWAIRLPLDEIRVGLETFGSVLEQSPGRFNLLEYQGATIVVDYAHNISALESFLEVLKEFPHDRRSVVYAVPGDRTDEVIIAQAEMLGHAYDRVILYEDTELRGRPEGSIFALMRRGLAKGTRTREILDVRGNMLAIETALASLVAGELLVIQPEFPDIGAEYFARLVAAGARETSLDRLGTETRIVAGR